MYFVHQVLLGQVGAPSGSLGTWGFRGRVGRRVVFVVGRLCRPPLGHPGQDHAFVTSLALPLSCNGELFVIDDSGKLVGSANAWASVIPKNTSKASFIFHLVALNNKTYGTPSSFTHLMIEALAKWS